MRETNEVALAVRKYAKEIGIPIITDKKLARKIYATHRRYDYVSFENIDEILRLLLWLEDVENAGQPVPDELLPSEDKFKEGERCGLKYIPMAMCVGLAIIRRLLLTSDWGEMLFLLILYCLGSMIIVLIFDFIAEYFLFMKDMKMDKQEVKREYKEQEGNPEIKSKRRERHQEILSEQKK